MIRLLGSGGLSHDGIAAKAARLDEAAQLGLAVPRSSVVPDGVEPQVAASRIVARHRGPLAVRSAFSAEDTADVSLAGHFESILNVAPIADDVAIAIDRVRSSGAADYRRDVLVMDMVDAQFAGVAFTEPGWLDDSVNVTAGLGDALLSGGEAGHSLELDRRDRTRDSAPWQSRLAALLAAVRNAFGDEPWDVEFADDGTTCWLLQIRPITAAPLRNDWFTLANHREILPDPPSVFMTSLIEYAAPQLSGPLGILSANSTNRRFIEVFDRRPYINLSLLTDFMRDIGLPTSLVADSLGGATGTTVAVQPKQLIRRSPALVQMGVQQLFATRVARRVARDLAGVRPTFGDRFGPIIEESAATYVALVDQMASLATAMAVPVSLVGKFGTLDYHLRKQRTDATQMLDGLRDLADVVRGSPDTLETLEAGEVPDHPEFAQAWDRWLERHGQRGVFESDLASPRYSEDPTSVLTTIGRLANSSRPSVNAIGSTKALLSTPIWMIARGPMAAREAIRADAMRAFAIHRADLLHCAKGAVERGALPSVDDVWLLSLDELRQVDDGLVIDQAFMSARRNEFERTAAIDVPDLRRRSGPVDTGSFEDGVLRGLSLTRGTCVGVALVLDEPTDQMPDEVAGLDPDQVILIARSVDAGWVPLFGQVGAVAVDIGGDLSHGSIVLRELGLPAITNTRNGTQLLKTGDRVRLDAAAGTLYYGSAGS